MNTYIFIITMMVILAITAMSLVAMTHGNTKVAERAIEILAQFVTKITIRKK